MPNEHPERACCNYLIHAFSYIASFLCCCFSFFVQNMEPCDRKISLCYKYQRRYKKLNCLFYASIGFLDTLFLMEYFCLCI